MSFTSPPLVGFRRPPGQEYETSDRSPVYRVRMAYWLCHCLPELMGPVWMWRKLRIKDAPTEGVYYRSSHRYWDFATKSLTAVDGSPSRYLNLLESFLEDPPRQFIETSALKGLDGSILEPIPRKFGGLAKLCASSGLGDVVPLDPQRGPLTYNVSDYMDEFHIDPLNIEEVSALAEDPGRVAEGITAGLSVEHEVIGHLVRSDRSVSDLNLGILSSTAGFTHSAEVKDKLDPSSLNIDIETINAADAALRDITMMSRGGDLTITEKEQMELLELSEILSDCDPVEFDRVMSLYTREAHERCQAAGVDPPYRPTKGGDNGARLRALQDIENGLLTRANAPFTSDGRRRYPNSRLRRPE